MENLEKRREKKEGSPGWLTNTEAVSPTQKQEQALLSLDVLVRKLGKKSMSPEKGHSIYYQEYFSLSIFKYSWFITQFITLKHAELHAFIFMFTLIIS